MVGHNGWGTGSHLEWKLPAKMIEQKDRTLIPDDCESLYTSDGLPISVLVLYERKINPMVGRL